MTAHGAFVWTALAGLFAALVLGKLPAPQFATTFGVLCSLYLVGKDIGAAAIKAADGFIAQSEARRKEAGP